MLAKIRTLSNLFLTLVGYPPGCASRDPVWANAVLLSLAGVLTGVVGLVAGAPWSFGSPMPWLPATTAAAGFVVGRVLDRLFVPEQWHSHCQVCGVCSIAAGIPATRTEQALIQAIEAAGWRVTGNVEDLCPQHHGDVEPGEPVRVPGHAYLHAGSGRPVPLQIYHIDDADLAAWADHTRIDQPHP
ncbi:MAG: hypothetical protein V7603_5186 [Micromonosporaceae bacterium]